MVRILALDPGAQFFTRNLLVSSDHYLLEFRHPFLRRNDMTQGVGLRFIGLAHEAWARSDDISVMLDGSRQPHELWKSLFGSGWEETFRKAELAEAYIRFVLDHTEFNGEQLYVVSARRDFKTTLQPPDGHDHEYLTAQFVVSLSPTRGELAAPSESERFLSALQLGEETQIVPPTMLRTVPQAGTVPEHAIVFATVVFRGRLLHVCLKASADGQIAPLKKLAQTPQGITLPLVALRSFSDQRLSVAQAADNPPLAGAP